MERKQWQIIVAELGELREIVCQPTH